MPYLTTRELEYQQDKGCCCRFLAYCCFSIFLSIMILATFFPFPDKLIFIISGTLTFILGMISIFLSTRQTVI